MTPSAAAPTTLLGLLASSPAEQTAIIIPEQNIRITYGALRRQVVAVAEALAARGIGRGDRVGMALPNGLPAIVAFLAAAEAGTAAPLNPGYKEDEFRFYLEDTNARVLLLPPDGAADARRAAGDRVRVLSVEMDASGTVTISEPAGAPASSGAEGRSYAPPTVDDTALILHTSGSTGRPKRVPLKHANLSISARNVAASYKLTPDDVSLCVMPLFHVHGLVASTLATLATGGTVIVPRSSVRCRSGAWRAITVRPGIQRCRPCTSCCSPGPTRLPNLPALKSCASSVRAAPRCRRRSCTISRPRSARLCWRRTE
jgi:acyl-CoA synthetase (AMP-forming)/AMP-acid ligase II